MKIKSKKWPLWISIPAIIAVSLIIFFTVSEKLHSSLHAPWQNIGPNNIPNHIFWISVILMILAIAPISYYFISRRLEEKLEKNMKIILNLINKNQITKREQKEINNKNIILRFLNPNEKEIVKKLVENKGEALQSEISRMGGMTKLKTHRAVRDLERKGVIKTRAYGKTNRIILTDDIKELLIKGC